MNGVKIRKPGKAPRKKAARKTAAKVADPVAKPMRPAQCRKHLREALGREFPAIVDGFVMQARKGSVQHFRAAKALMEEFAAKPRRRKGPVQQLLDELDNMDEATRTRLLSEGPEQAGDGGWLP